MLGSIYLRQQRNLRPFAVVRLVREIRTKSATDSTRIRARKPILETMPSIQIAYDPQSMAELIVRNTEDFAIPKVLFTLQRLRKTALGNKSMDSALQFAGFDEKTFPSWLQDWLKGTLTVAEKYDPFPFSLPTEDVESVTTEIGVYLFCLRFKKSREFADFMLNHLVDSKNTNAFTFSHLPFKRIQTSMQLAGELGRTLNDRKLRFVRNVLRKHHRNEILREHVIMIMSDRLSLHVDVMQSLYEHVLGDRKRELGIFSYAKKYNREQMLRGLRRELNLIMWRRQQLDIDSNIADENFDLPVLAFTPDDDSVSRNDIQKDAVNLLASTLKKNFHFFQQRIYIGIHHMFQFNINCSRSLPPLSSTVSREEETRPDETTASRTALMSALHELDGNNTDTISLEDYLGKVSLSEEDDVITPNGMRDTEESSEEMSSNVGLGPAKRWIYTKLTQESQDERFKLRSKEYDDILHQLKEENGVRNAIPQEDGTGKNQETSARPMNSFVEVGANVELSEEERAKQLAEIEQMRAIVVDEIIRQDPYASSKRKALLLNLPADITEEEIRDSLRNIGTVSKVWIFAHSFIAGIDEASKKKGIAGDGGDMQPKDSEQFDDNNESLVKDTEDEVDDGEAVDDEDESLFDDGERDPLNMFASSENALDGTDGSKKSAKRRKPTVRRKILERMKLINSDNQDITDTYAYVQMADDEGFERLTSDLMRIFGMSIKKRPCKTLTAESLTHFFIELHYPMRISNVVHTINLLLAKDHVISVGNREIDDHMKPMFLKLQFPTHEECWEAYQLLARNPVIYDSILGNPSLPANDPSNVRSAEQNQMTAWQLCWRRTRNYWELSMRARRSLEGLEYKYFRESADTQNPMPNDSALPSNDAETGSMFANPPALEPLAVLQEKMT